ncbi:tyrosine-tRNA ligase [Cavenderia fasciculata]|uniref:Tyrosine--tRNA ligase n=1 Tax=Cavenderia fasciculata TaxID=261658 RepID=F4PUF7_CACFS|nr:tyrosine-tRNA ligase [Cavenderia fasciculata]EGG21029.1 tyrosine-tRNA ligase [Cavenderia fasciculata]|eukprot:XP_004358879.1 tyrosine-tRNA ligase [Cavenderia fasciculata]
MLTALKRTSILSNRYIGFSSSSSLIRNFSTTTTTFTTSTTNVIDTLKSRGFIYQMTANDEEMKKLTSKPVSLYAGFDPTANSLHIGNLIQLMVLLQFKRHGHNPIALLGGATALIGDPSGKSTDRPQLDQTFITDNSKIIRENIETILGKDNLIVDNYDWNKDISIISFFRDIGKYFRIGSMLRKDFIQNRIGQVMEIPKGNGETTEKCVVLNNTSDSTGISLPEFCYSLFQSNDYVHLHSTHNCVIQIGGSDQWGNITDGCDLIKKKLNKTAHGITIPLLTNSQGKKLGKSEGNSIWLSASRTSPFNFFQYWIQIADDDVEKLLNLFTFIPLQEIKEVMEKHRAEPHLRHAQRVLAEHVTRIVHGDQGVEEAINTTKLLFSEDSLSILDSYRNDPVRADSLFSKLNFKEIEISQYPIQGEKSATVASIFQSASSASRNQVKQLIESKSIQINGTTVTPGQKIQQSDLIGNHYIILRQVYLKLTEKR